ncbi:hypothetical protein LCGC14_0407370 [marine sediment metagenome]|uniref:Uncharacterized protein n=1 Tax=marine sediment metagenome TaxID=412755 RepID=A0A0F9SUZ9_9ZZZZ
MTTDSLDRMKSPIDKDKAEVGPLGAKDKRLSIFARGGDPVRSTHPGRVKSIIKSQKFFTIILAATENGTDLSGRTPSDPNVNLAEFPNTSYANLGSVNVQVGEKVSAGHQIGTVSFFPTGGKTGIRYGVNANGSGTEAAKLSPQGELARNLIKRVQVDPGAAQEGDETANSTGIKEAPKDADLETQGLNELAAVKELESEGLLEQAGVSNFPYITRPQVKFVEHKNQVFSHDVMVFISGVDVSGYLVGQLNINIVDKDGWNECNLTLNNAMNNFVITQENMGFNNDLKGTFRTADGQGERKYSEQAKKDLIEYKNDLNRNPLVDIEKMRLTQVSITQGVENIDATGKQIDAVSNATGKVVPPVKGEAVAPKKNRAEKTTFQANTGLTDRRWQLGFMSTVFHKHDPIRVFRKNPIREANEWMPAFTGYLSEISYDTNYINGQSQVKISCYDIRAIAAKMRVQETAVTGVTNPRALFQGKDAAGSASLFTDLLSPTIQGHPLQAKRYEDVMEFLITGTSTESEELNKAFGESKFRRGIGDFTLGEKISYRPGDSKAEKKIAPDPLEHWHALCLFGTNGANQFRRVSLDGDASEKVGGVIKTIKKTTEKEEQLLNSTQGSVSAEKVAAATGNLDRRYLTAAEATYIGKATTHDGEWSPHKQYVHFLLPASGTGAKNLLDSDVENANSNQIDFRSRLDIMQDFSARIDYQFWVSPMGDFIVEFPQYDFMPEDYGEYSTVFKVDKHLTSDTIQDEAGDMVTCVIAHGRIRPEGEASNIPDFIQPKAVVVSPMMMMRYGVLEHELTLPFVSQVDALGRLAQIEFQKKLAESNKMNMAFNYRPWILPNRPMEHMERKRIGLTTVVNNSLTVFKEGNTAITTRYVRRQIFRPDGTANYTFIFSGTTMPITYREIFENSTITPATGSAKGTPVLAGSEDRTTSLPAKEEPLQTETSAQVSTGVQDIAEPGGSPVPSAESVGRFLAMAQQNSGWNPLNRLLDGSYGLFGLSSEQREGLGIGDSADINEQTIAADGYWRKLTYKWKGDFDMVAAEFDLGPDGIKNPLTLENWKKTKGAVNKKLGAAWEKIAQPLKSAYSELFPGEVDPVEVAKSAEAKAAVEEAETAGVLPSGQGFQSTVGVLVFATSDVAATPSTEAGAIEVQAEQSRFKYEFDFGDEDEDQG